MSRSQDEIEDAWCDYLSMLQNPPAPHPWALSVVLTALSPSPAAPRIQSRRSVSEADFPAWWAAHWKARGYGVVPEHAPDSIPGALAAAHARMGALTGDRM